MTSSSPLLGSSGFLRIGKVHQQRRARQAEVKRLQIHPREEEGAVWLELARSAATTAPVSYIFKCVVSVIDCFQSVLLLLQALPRGPAILCLQQIA